MELLHLAHCNVSSSVEDRIGEQEAVDDVNDRLAVRVSRSIIVTICEDHNFKDSANGNDNHRNLEARNALLEHEVGQYERV